MSIVQAVSEKEQGPGQFSFYSLPREIRDQIYKLLVVSTGTVRFHPTLGLLILGSIIESGIPLLYGHTLNVQLTREICEAGYKENAFNINISVMEAFLSCKT